jgi:hypothetical protein
MPVHRNVGPVPEGYERMVRQLGEAWMMCSGGQFYEQIIESLLLLCLLSSTWIVQGNDIRNIKP